MSNESFLRNIKPSFFVLTISTVIILIVMVFVPPIPQNLEFHDFADKRKLINTPNFWDVITNIPFLFIGILGLLKLSKKRFKGVLYDLINAYRMFFFGLILIGFGSGYYHLDPNNDSLVWDRLPITLSFMAFFTISLGESISTHTASKLFYPLLLIGILSVVYWNFTESIGEGDLRIYALVQFLPILIIPLLLLFYKSLLTGKGWIFTIIACYGFAKVAEFLDHQIYQWIGFSGHSLKHLIAAFGAYLFLVSFQYRKSLSY